MSTEHTEPAGLSDEELLQIAEDSCMDLFKRKRRDPDGIAIEEGYWEAWDHQLLAFARAVEAATLARAQRQPVPPADGEVAELVAWLLMQGEAQKPGPNSLLCDKTKKELHTNGARLIRVANLLAQRHPQPVPLSERPWEREGWCDEQGRCWALNEHLPAWELHDCADSRKWADLFFPAHALPLPVEVEG